MSNVDLIGILIGLFSNYFSYFLPIYGVMAAIATLLSLTVYALTLPSRGIRGVR